MPGRPATHRALRLPLLGLLLVLALGPFAWGPFGHGDAGAATVAQLSACPTSAGIGGTKATLAADTQGGHGCVVFRVGTSLVTFTYTGAVQQWTVPAGVTSVEVHLLGAGGGGAHAAGGDGGGGGYTTGTLTVTPGQVLDVIVGEGGRRQCAADIPPLSPPEARHNTTFGGGGSGNTEANLLFDCTFASGGGRSAIRAQGGTDDLATAGGGGGAGYSGSGGAGGGLAGDAGTGSAGQGGTQVAGGATHPSQPGTAGIKYGGGWCGYSTTSERAASEGGGGGGGWWGGGAGGDNGGGGGGSGHVGSLTNATTIAGSGRATGIPTPSATVAPTISGTAEVGATLTAVSGTWTSAGVTSWQWQVSTDGVTFSDVPGATGATFVPTSTDTVRVVETRSTPFVSVSASSTAVLVAPAPTTTSTTTTTTVRPRPPATGTTTTSTTSSTSTTTTLTPTVTTAPTTTLPVVDPVVPDQPDAGVAGNAPTDPFGGVDGTTRFLRLETGLVPGAAADGTPLRSRAGGLRPGSTVTLEVRSDPIVIDTAIADGTGTATFDSEVPPGLEPGIHRLILSGIAPSGETVTATAAFTIGPNGLVEAVLPSSESAGGPPSEAAVARALAAGAPVYDTSSNATTSAGLIIVASVVLGAMATARTSGSGATRTGSAPHGGVDDEPDSGGPPEIDDAGDDGERDTSAQGEIASVGTDAIDHVDADTAGRGDALRTWVLPGHLAHQQVVATTHATVARRSAIAGRLVEDGQWLRAAFGPVQLVVWLAGVAVGVVSATSVPAVVPPTFAVVATIVVLSGIDAMAGALAWLGFTAVVVTRHGIDSVFDLRVLIGLGVLFMAIPLVANLTRPFRRELDAEHALADRVGDYVLLALLMALAARSMYTALNGLSGLFVVQPDDAATLRWVAGAVVLGRLGIEDLVTRTYPSRIEATKLAPAPERGLVANLGVITVRGGLFLLGAAPFLGLGWRTWLVIALMSLVPVLELFEHHFPNFVALHRWFPRGVLRTTAMLYVSVWYAAWVLGGDSSAEHTKAMFAFLLLPGVVLGKLDTVSRHGGDWPNTRWKRAVGAALWAITFAVLYGQITV